MVLCLVCWGFVFCSFCFLPNVQCTSPPNLFPPPLPPPHHPRPAPRRREGVAHCGSGALPRPRGRPQAARPRSNSDSIRSSSYSIGSIIFHPNGNNELPVIVHVSQRLRRMLWTQWRSPFGQQIEFADACLMGQLFVARSESVRNLKSRRIERCVNHIFCNFPI